MSARDYFREGREVAKTMMYGGKRIGWEREAQEYIAKLMPLAEYNYNLRLSQQRLLDGNPDSNTAAQSGPGDEPKRRGVRS